MNRGYCDVGVVVAMVFGAIIMGFVDPDSAIGKLRYVFFRARGEVAGPNLEVPRPLQHRPARRPAQKCKENLKRIQRGKVTAGKRRGNNMGGITWEEVCSAMFPTEVQLKSNPSRLEQVQTQVPVRSHLRARRRAGNAPMLDWSLTGQQFGTDPRHCGDLTPKHLRIECRRNSTPLDCGSPLPLYPKGQPAGRWHCGIHFEIKARMSPFLRRMFEPAPSGYLLRIESI